MPRTASARVLLALILTAVPGLASAQSTRGAVPIYDSTQLAFDRYTVIKRLGIADRRSAFRIAGYGDLQSAQSALVDEATRLGADGVINLACFDQTDRIFNPAGYFCYGNAIRLKK